MMSNGVVSVISDTGLTVSNGTVVIYEENHYLVTCAHSFYDKNIREIHFFIEPKIKKNSLIGSCHLEKLSFPFFHYKDTTELTYEVGIIKLRKNEIAKLLEKKITFPALLTETPKLKISDKIYFTGYNANILNKESFQGKLNLMTTKLSFVLRAIKLNGYRPLSSRAPVDCYIAAKEKVDNLGSGFSGSIVHLGNQNEIIGIYHTTAAPLLNGFDKLTPEGCAIFTSCERIVEAIKNKKI